MSNIPAHLRYTNTHEWLNNTHEEAVIGITEHAQALLGDLVFVELPVVGTKVHAGEELGVVESVKAASDFYAPITGVVVAVNEAVNTNPALVNSEPYDSGWLVKIAPSNAAEIETLLSPLQYQQQITEEH